VKKVPRAVVQNVSKSNRGAARKEWTSQKAVEIGFDVTKYTAYRLLFTRYSGQET